MALGDSYTIGTGLQDESQNFPSLLARRLTEETGIDVALVNLGVNGYTTTDLIREELPVAGSLRPELVSILIGANDVVQGSDEATYRVRLDEIYQAVERLGVLASRALAISVPDFSALPGAAPFGSAGDLRARIDAFNHIAESESAPHGFWYVDISAITRATNHGNDWLADDGLHPGPAQHRAIADRLWQDVAPAWRRVVLSRFSPPAHRVVELAFAEAVGMQSQYTGSEHILLSLLKLDGGSVRNLLGELGITYQGVRKISTAMLERKPKGATSRQSPILTTRTTEVLATATREAAKAGAATVGPEHLLIALIGSDGIAYHILADAGVTLPRIRTAIEGLKPNAEGVSQRPPGAWSRFLGRLLGKH